jgi:DNA-binding beta-propeller fold protein YncE
VPAGVHPFGIAVSPDGSGVYVANNSDSTVSQYDIGAGGALSPKATPTVATATGPLEVRLLPATTPPATNPPSSPSPAPTPAVPAGPTAAELVLRCANRKLVLTDVMMRTGGVSLVGVADKSLAGQHVQIVFSAGKTIATAVVGADGWFSATAPLPKKSIRGTNRARYTAVVGNEKSLALKLTRRVVMEPLTSKAGIVTLTGQVIPPLTKPAAEILVQAQVSCTQWKTTARKPAHASGRFEVSVAAPAGQQAAVYRVSTAVRKNRLARRGSGATRCTVAVAPLRRLGGARKR